MPQLIDFSNLKHKMQHRNLEDYAAESDSCGMDSNSDSQTNKFISILLEQNQGKLVYSLKETAQILGISQEFIRRRVKNGKIKAVSFGDKPAVNIIELARILSEGV